MVIDDGTLSNVVQDHFCLPVELRSHSKAALVDDCEVKGLALRRALVAEEQAGVFVFLTRNHEHRCVKQDVLVEVLEVGHALEAGY